MAETPIKILRPPLLERYYPVVRELRTYLADILESDIRNVIEATQTANSNADVYYELLNTSFVTLKRADAANISPRFKVNPPIMTDMREIIDVSQARLLKNKASQNVITAGYRQGSRDGDSGNKGRTRIGITNYYINTIVTALQAPEWETLLQSIGTDAMIHLLTETNLFISLPNDCLCQMTGEPIVHLKANPQNQQELDRSERLPGKVSTRGSLKRPLTDPTDQEQRAKRLKVTTGMPKSGNRLPVNATMRASIHSPADIALPRSRLFYARPTFLPHTNRIAIGIPPKHILHRLLPSYPQNLKLNSEIATLVTASRSQMENARHLAKYVFPRQYGLSSPFNFQISKREAFKFPDFSNRDVEIKILGSCKTPKRLKEILSVLETMIWRHGKCKYKLLRDSACPTTVVSPAKQPLDSSIILELMSEQTTQPQSQMSFGGNTSLDSAGNSIIAQGLTQAEKYAKNKPRFVEFSCSHVQVYRFVVLVTKAVIPHAFWGDETNFKLICQYVKSFIACRRYETFSLHHVLQSFSTSACEWLMPPGSGERQNRVPVSDALKRRELLEDCLFWYFDSFVSPLLKTTFYITESSAFRNKVLYFRHDDWQTLCAPLIERLTVGTFQKMTETEAEELLRQRKMGFAFVRLLPKDTGVRPIVNLRRRKHGNPGMNQFSEQSINQILQAAFHILTYEKKSRPELLGASVFSPDEVYMKLKGFKSRLPRNAHGTLPKLYFVKVDVQACFDTIEQDKLLEILRDLISEDVYMIQKYGQVSSAAGKIKRSYVKKAIPDDEHPHFIRHATELANALRHTIFVDQVTYSTSRKEEILHLLEEHITENIVRIGKDYYRQIIGIPQGSILSTLLCSFFYGDLEKRFGKFTEDLQSVLLRLIDDNLFITTNLAKAKAFLSMMNRGHPEYGCFISRNKTMTNFDYDDQILNVTAPQQQEFPWCGYNIDMKDLSITVDYTRYHGFELQDSLTVDRGRRPGVAFQNKMLQLAKTRSHIIYSDIDLNTDYVVHLNIYQNFLLCAMKMHCYIRNWGLDVRKHKSFIRDTVRQMIMYCYATLRSKASNKVVKANGGRITVQKLDVDWLGTHAFHSVLSRKPQRYATLTKLLASDIHRRQHRRCIKRFRRLVKDGLAGLTQIS